MADLAKLVVKLEAQTAQYMAGMERAQKQLAKFTSAAGALKGIGQIVNAAIGGAVVKAIISAGKASIDATDRIGKLAQSTGVAVKEMSELAYSAGLSNVDVTMLSKSLVTLNQNALKSAQATKATSDAFSKLGVSVKNADGSLKSSDALLIDVAERFSQIQDGAAKTAIAIDLFGKNGAALIPFLNQGRKGIEDLHKEASRLGLVLTDEAAKAAGDFNDDLTRLQKAFDGVIAQTASKLLPQLADLAQRFVDIANDGTTLQSFIDGLITSFKVLITVGTAVGTVFQVIGKSIGAVVGALASLDLKSFDFSSPQAFVLGIARSAGNARTALEVLKEGFGDITSTVANNVSAMNKLWSDQNDQLQEVIVTASRYKETLADLGSGGSILKEVKVTAQKIELTPMEQYYEQLREMSRTDTEQRVNEFHKQNEALKESLALRIINEQQYYAKLEELQSDVLGLEEIEITVKKVSEVVQKTTNELTEFQKQAARNTVDIIADTLENGFSDGIDGVLDAFQKMITKLVAQAIAADLGKRLFGSDGSMGGSDGWIGTAMNFVGGLFGGKRDSGGRGRAGVAYAIGTGAQPEMFVPDTSGTFYPADQMRGAGGGMVTQNIRVEGRVTNETARQLALQSARQQRIAQARFG